MIARFAGVAPREARARVAFAAAICAGVVATLAAQPGWSDARSSSASDPRMRVTAREYPMHAGVSPPFVTLGERFTYRGWIAVEKSTKVRWNPPAAGGEFTWGEMKSGSAPLTRPRANGPWPAESVWVEIPLQVFATGQISVPGLGFTLDDGRGGLRPGHLPIVRLGVTPSIAASDTAADLRAPRGPLAAPWWERVPWRYVVAGAGLLAIAIVVIRRARRRPVAAPAAAPIAVRRREPAAEALAELAALRRMMLLEAGKFDDHALRLSHILRRYLEATVGALRPGDSTTELLRRLEAGLLAPDDVKRLSQLLRRWDGIKFARLPSDVEEGRRCEEAVRELVLRTSRRAEPEVA